MVVNDFVIPLHQLQQNQVNRGRQFQVWFDIGVADQMGSSLQETQESTQGYYLKDLGVGFGAYKLLNIYGN